MTADRLAMGDPLYFEDFTPGAEIDCGETRLSADQIMAFARAYDPQPMHLDAETAAASLLGGIAASGWHVCALVMRLYYEGLIRRARGQGSPGIREVRWRRPARAGAVLGLHVRVTDARASRSRPRTGLVGFETTLTDRGSGDIVCTQTYKVMIERRAPMTDAEAAALDAGGQEKRQENRQETPQEKPATWPTDAPLDPNQTFAPADQALAYGAADEIPLGCAVDLGDERLDAAAIIAFAEQFDPQPFHTDPAAAAASPFGGLIASGWHSAALWMGRWVRARQAAVAALPPDRRARAEAAGGPGLTVEYLRWKRPVYAGDRLRFATKALARAPFPSRPGWTRVLSDNWATNQHGDVAVRFHSSMLVRDDA